MVPVFFESSRHRDFSFFQQPEVFSASNHRVHIRHSAANFNIARVETGKRVKTRSEQTVMTLGKETFGLNKSEFTQKLGRIITNFRANSKLIGEPAQFVIRCCKLTRRWEKLATDPETVIYLRNVEIAGGRKIKMISLERGGTRQPVPKAQLIGELYPTKRIATSATPEEAHFMKVKVAMRRGIQPQLKEYRDGCTLPSVCHISGKKIRLGNRTDIDHVGMPFSEIADRFMAANNITYTEISLKGPPTAKMFSDTALWNQWIEFHREHAKYALTLASANRSKGSEGYETPRELIGSFAKEDPEDLALDF